MRITTAGFLLAALASTVSSAGAERVGPWDLDALRNKVPAMKWISRDAKIHSLSYSGETYRDRPTEVFAFYASPVTVGDAKPGSRFPGVVLIHGGGGTAFADWVWLWAKRGYAAIAMDLGGMRPPDPKYDPVTGAPMGHQSDSKIRSPFPNGGPAQGHGEKFDTIGGSHLDDWPFHAAASVIRAHTLLRSFPEVDPDRTAVTGISWGGYTTCLVASLDDRFKAAVPVYGCGFLHEGDSVQRPSIDKLGARAADWVREYDPSSLLPRCRVPILFVNGTNDVHYPLDSYQKNFAVVPGDKQMRIEVNMRHGHPPGWAPKEIGLFIDSKCNGGAALPKPGKVEIVADQVKLAFQSQTSVTKAELHYTTDGGIRSKRTWKSIPATIAAGVVTAPRPPAEANTWFISLTDERGAMITSDIQFAQDS